MISLTRVKQATDEFIKVLRYGKNDIQTASQYLPAGIDSKPIAEDLAAHATTSGRGKQIVFGYISNSDKTKEGEIRVYSRDSGGNEMFIMKLCNDGTALLGGDSDFLMRFSKTEKAYNQLKEDHNSLVDAFNQHMHATAATGPPSIPTPIPNVIPTQQSTGDISSAKIEEIKTL